MNLTVHHESKVVEVMLSERNLLALLSKLSRKDSHHSLARHCEQENGSAWTLWVKVEEDAQHYGEREPGGLHPTDEAYVQEIQSLKGAA